MFILSMETTSYKIVIDHIPRFVCNIQCISILPRAYTYNIIAYKPREWSITIYIILIYISYVRTFRICAYSNLTYAVRYFILTLLSLVVHAVYLYI